MRDVKCRFILTASLVVGTVFLMFVAGVENSYSQVGSSAILGYITDSSGAVVPSAKLKLTNPATGFERDIQSNAAGFFKFADLLPGSYNLVVTQQGFAAFRAEGLVLQVDQQREQNVTLHLGQTTQEITVRAASELLETSSATTGQVITDYTVTALPLNGRNFLQLATLATGTTPQVLQGSAASYAMLTGRPSNAVEIGGNRETSTSFLFDGIEARNDRVGALTFQLSVDEIQEFKVMRNFFPAEYGFAPGIVNVATKSGSNKLHGAVWEFLRNNDFDSRNYFGTSVEPFHQNQFGATIGGPVLANKFFFFGDYEGLRKHLSSATSGIYPDNQQLGGNLADLTVFGNAPIYDPSTYNPVTGTRQAFPGNVIPTNRINPYALKTIQLEFPNLNTPSYGSPNLFGYPLTAQTDDQFTVRLDGQNVNTFGKKSQIFGRFSLINSSLVTASLAPYQGTNIPQNDRNVVFQVDTPFSTNTINEFRVGYQRDYTPYLSQGSGGTVDFTQELGFTNTSRNPRDFLAPEFCLLGIDCTGALYNLENTTNRYIISDNLTHIVGKHSLKFGGEYRAYRLLEETSTFAEGFLNYTGQFTSQTTLDPTSGAIGVVSGTGSPIADFLLGYPASGLGAFGSTQNHFRVWQAGVYFQDDWNVQPGFTLQAGLRWEPAGVPTSEERHVSIFDFATGTEKFPSLHETPPGVFTTPKKVFEPRLGFAYSPNFDKRSVLRGGGGIYTELTRRDDLQFLTFGPPYYALQSFSLTVNNPIPSYVLGQNTFPALPASVTIPSVGYVPPPGSSVGTPTPVVKTPTIYQWTLDYERSFGRNWLLEVGYAGLAGRHLGTLYDADQCSVLLPPHNLLCDPNARPFPQLAQIFVTTNSAYSNANALNVRGERKLANGLALLVAYRWMKSLDIDTQSGTSTDVSRTACRPCNYGPSDIDIRHRFVASPVWELPIGKNKRFFSNAGRLGNMAAGGWSVSSITTFQTGPVGNVTPTNSTADSGFNAHYGDCNLLGPGKQYASGNLRHNGMEWLNAADFGNPAPNYFGDCGRNTFHGPGLNNWDIAVMKDFSFTESVRMQFRAEFFNAFNHAQFDMPNATTIDNNAQNPAFGVVTAAERPRVVQFALKLNY